MNTFILQLKYPLNQNCFLPPPNQKKSKPLLPPLRSVATVAAGDQKEPPLVQFAFVSPRLLPDGTPDIQMRLAAGGQKLRDIMLDAYIDLYGPYDAPLSNCSGFGTCGTCLVEVVEGKELLSPRTDKEKEKLKKKPKTWRLACQTLVGDKDSIGEVVIQQLPEWKVIQWE
uniref:Photosynthetic NDH subcomplex B 3 n=1 Tax=Masdevallia picturata TaxID=125444 RepID=A0A0F7GXU4_9ASPA